MRKGVIVRTCEDFLFYARSRTTDLYAICCEEVYELENWFKPRAKDAVIDVGAYIGTYTVRAMKRLNKLSGSNHYLQILKFFRKY
jgi:hypothetical protein